MEKGHVSAILLVLFQFYIVIREGLKLLLTDIDMVSVVAVLVGSIILIAIYRREAVWARQFGIVFGGLQILIGCFLIVAGVLRLFTFSIGGIGDGMAGVVVVGLGVWTLSVIRQVAREHKRGAA